MVLGFFVVLNFTNISRNMNEGTQFSKTNKPLYRYMIILDGSNQSYVNELRRGAETAAKDYSIVFELWAFEGEDKVDKIIRQFDIGVESNVDGIIIQAMDNEAFSETLGKANYRNIPVITIGTKIPRDNIVSDISYNEYQIGSQIGKIISGYFKSNEISSGTIVLFQNSNSNGLDNGLAIKEKLTDAFVIKPIFIDYEGENTLNAEGVTKDILRQYSDIVAIICSTGEETLSAINGLKEMNRINDVLIIGSDDYPEILDYVEREIIYATTVSDNERLGYEAIVNMVENNNGQFVSQYRDIRVNIISKLGLDEYREAIGERDEY
jgi:ribose transport system substrate-binding protein